MGAPRNRTITNLVRIPWELRGEDVPVTSRFVQVGGVRVRVLEQGRGEPVLFIHGVGGWAEHWKGVLPAVAGAGFRAIAFDLPGFGHSSPPRQVRYLDPPDPYYARFVRELVEALGLDQVNVVGHSLGGAIAAVTAMCFPEIVRRLVLVAPGGFGQTVTPRLRLCCLPLFAQAARVVPGAVLRRFVRGDFHDPARAPEWFYADALKYCRAGAAAEVGRVMSQLVTLRGPRHSLRRAWLRRAADIPCPTLVLWGRQDQTVPIASGKFFRRIANARSEIIDDAGHLVMLEQPAVLQERLVSFLKARARLPRPAALTALRSPAPGPRPLTGTPRVESRGRGTAR